MKDLITALEGKRTYNCVSLIITALITHPDALREVKRAIASRVS